MIQFKAMKLKAMHPLIMVSLALLIEAIAFASDQPQQVLPGCHYTCGDLTIPYIHLAWEIQPHKI